MCRIVRVNRVYFVLYSVPQVPPILETCYGEIIILFHSFAENFLNADGGRQREVAGRPLHQEWHRQILEEMCSQVSNDNYSKMFYSFLTQISYT